MAVLFVPPRGREKKVNVPPGESIKTPEIPAQARLLAWYE